MYVCKRINNSGNACSRTCSPFTYYMYNTYDNVNSLLVLLPSEISKFFTTFQLSLSQNASVTCANFHPFHTYKRHICYFNSSSKTEIRTDAFPLSTILSNPVYVHINEHKLELFFISKFYYNNHDI